MVFSSYVVGLFGLFILEFSLWNNFGNYIWYVSIGFTILDMVIGDIVSYQLKEVGEGCGEFFVDDNEIAILLTATKHVLL